MSLRLGDLAPDFDALTTQGTIHFHEWIGDSWAVLFSHPRDFTPVCTTEVGLVARLGPEFRRRNVKVIGLSVDTLASHIEWIHDIEATQDAKVNFPLIADEEAVVADLYDMIHPEADETATVRCVFVIGPDKRIKLILAYPDSTGRSFREILRAIDSLQLTARHSVVTPVDWQPGEDVIIRAAMSGEDAAERFPDGWEARLPYLRLVACPKDESANV
jgi:thioredoxin-dependent peroxiredoxin